jgi:hypothetical protein
LVFLFFNFEITCIPSLHFPIWHSVQKLLCLIWCKFMTSPVGNLLLKKNWFIGLVKVVK